MWPATRKITLVRLYGAFNCRILPQLTQTKAAKFHSGLLARSPQWTPYIDQFWKFECHVHNGNIDVKSHQPEQMDLKKAMINYDGNDSDVCIEEDSKSNKVILKNKTDCSTRLRISLPAQIDIDLSVGSSDVAVSGVENSSISVKGTAGRVSLKNIKSERVNVHTTEGDIECSGSIRANIELSTTNGKIDTGKLQGTSISLSTHSGSIATADLYSEELTVSTENANVSLKSVHGDCEIQSGQGKVDVGTAEGHLNIMSEEGDITTFLTKKVTSCDISTNTGDVSLGFAADFGAQIDAEFCNVDETGATDSLMEVKTHRMGPCTRYRGGKTH